MFHIGIRFVTCLISVCAVGTSWAQTGRYPHAFNHHDRYRPMYGPSTPSPQYYPPPTGYNRQYGVSAYGPRNYHHDDWVRPSPTQLGTNTSPGYWGYGPGIGAYVGGWGYGAGWGGYGAPGYYGYSAYNGFAPYAPYYGVGPHWQSGSYFSGVPLPATTYGGGLYGTYIPAVPAVSDGPNWSELPPDLGGPGADNPAFLKAWRENQARWGDNPEPWKSTIDESGALAVRPSTATERLRSMEHQAAGDSALRGQRWQEAYLDYKRAIQSAEDRGEPHLRLGVAYAMMDRFDLAGQSFRRAAMLDAESLWTTSSLEELLSDSNNVSRLSMISRLSRWVESDLRNPDRLFVLGVVLHLERDPRSHDVFASAWRLAGRGRHIQAFLNPPSARGLAGAANPGIVVPPSPAPNAGPAPAIDGLSLPDPLSLPFKAVPGRQPSAPGPAAQAPASSNGVDQPGRLPPAPPPAPSPVPTSPESSPADVPPLTVPESVP